MIRSRWLQVPVMIFVKLFLTTILDRPVLQLGLGEGHEGNDAALVFEELQLDRPHLGLGSDGLKPNLDRLKLLSRNLAHQLTVPHGRGKLLLHCPDVSEEGLVVLNLLVEDGRGLLIKLGWDIISVNESLATE